MWPRGGCDPAGAEDMLRRMGDVRKQRLDKVRQRNRDVYEAVMWLSENQHRFKQPIFEPIMLQVRQPSARVWCN